MNIRFSQFSYFTILFLLCNQAYTETIFVENFDNQPDWHSGLLINTTDALPKGKADTEQRASTHTIPENWYSIRQEPAWAPSTGHNDRHEAIEILASNADKAFGGIGKSYVSWRDSASPSHYWNSDSQLLKYFPEGYEQLYIEFWIRFSPDWTTTASNDASKFFRVGSWNGNGSEYLAFENGNQGPLFLWDWKRDEFGVRNVHTLRGGPHGQNYFLNSDDLADHPRGSMNFTKDTLGMSPNGTNPALRDKKNGGFIDPNSGAIIEHEQIFGDGDNWTKIAFFVRMNSAPSAQDGVLIQWLNDEQILYVNTIPWIKHTDNNLMAKWNFFSIGGNDFFHSYPDSERREEWYSIDNIMVSTTIPPEHPMDFTYSQE